MICRNQVVHKRPDGYMYVHPCGQCLACRINDTRAWFVRTFFECKKMDRPFQYFLTLTYNDESLPNDGLCSKKEAKSFINTFNTYYMLRLRYFFTSDYGNLNGRPHYHAIFLSTKKITTKMVERIWRKGYVKLKPLTKKNMKYTLRYTVKKQPFDGSLDGWFRLISKGWGLNAKDYYPNDGYYIIDGKKYAVPMYIERKMCPIPKWVDKSKFYDRLWLEHRDVIGTDGRSLDDLRKLYSERNKYVETD